MTVVKLADPVIVAIITRLRADATLRALIVGSTTPEWGIYDEVPQGKSYPYVQIDTAPETVDDTFSKQGGTLTLTAHVWSQYSGRKEASDILDRIKDLLHHYALSVSGYTLEWCSVDMTDVLRDPDGRTRHGIATIRVQARET